MKLLALLLAAMVLTIIGLAIKVEVEFLYKRKEKKDHLDIKLKAFKGLWSFTLVIPNLDLEWEKGPQLEFEQAVQTFTGGERKSKGKIGVKFINGHFLYKFWPRIPQFIYRLQKVKKRFYRSIHCTALDWKIEVGYKDPSYTAIAAGTFWAFLGFALSRLYKQITVNTNKPKINVIPQFDKEGFYCNFYCIFHMRIGHIIFAGIDLVRIFQRGRRGKLYG